MPETAPESADVVSLATNIVSAFVANNSLPLADLPALIQSVHTALVSLASGALIQSTAAKPAPVAAVTVRKSITPEYLICLDDGLKFKSMRRHLTTLGMTPDQYREKWNLPADYPMVAANYAAARSELAKNAGFGLHKSVGNSRPQSAARTKGSRGRPRKPAA